MTNLTDTPSFPTIRINGEVRDFSRPWVMGIINATPDSFFSGSRTPDSESLQLRIQSLIDQGADCLDIGACSTRPGAEDISAELEWQRLCPALKLARSLAPEAVISIDTFRADIARKAVSYFGANIINDISGGDMDPEMFSTIAELQVPYILMHTRGTPANMQSLTQYNDVTADVITDLAFKVDRLHSLGVADIIIDPGFGFAKTTLQNFKLLAQLNEFKRMGMPVLAGLSRKSMVWRPLGITPEESLNPTTALNMTALLNGADILRVHDVKEANQTIELFLNLKNSNLNNHGEQ